MRKRLLVVVLLGVYQHALSQNDTLKYSVVFESSAANDPGNLIYNGREHIPYPQTIDGNPYLMSQDWQKGSIVFQDILFKDVYLKYDLVADEVIILHPDIYAGVVLFTPRIHSFDLNGKSFIYFSEMGDKGLKTGIYEHAVKGKLSLYIKHSKMIEEKIVNKALEKKFVDKKVFYVLKDGQYHSVRKQKDVIELMQDRKKEVNSFLKSQQIKYKNNPEYFLINLIQHYNQLNP